MKHTPKFLQRAEEMCEWIIATIEAGGFCPSYAEIARHFDNMSNSSIERYVDYLVEVGKLRRFGGRTAQARSLAPPLRPAAGDLLERAAVLLEEVDAMRGVDALLWNERRAAWLADYRRRTDAQG